MTLTGTDDALAAIEPAIAMVEQWLGEAAAYETRRSRQTMKRSSLERCDFIRSTPTSSGLP